MKKVISKILIILIIFVLLYEFAFSSFLGIGSYAVVDSATRFLVFHTPNLAGGLVSIFYTLLKAIIVGLTYAIQVITTIVAGASGTFDEGGFFSEVYDPITPFDIFYNKYKLLDVNFFDFTNIDENSFVYTFRLTVAEWYTLVKFIACAILLVILIYVGVMMAISTVADDKAKYKKMLVDWVVSLLLIFVLQYIIIFTVYCNSAIVAALKTMFETGSTSVSDTILKIGLQGIVGGGIESMASVIVYIMIVFQTIGFLLAYIKRMIKVGFLIMISPLITITYSIDKMGDGKAQALGNWLKEFVYTILIQPFHCIMYVALVKTAFELLVNNFVNPGYAVGSSYNQLVNGVLAILCIKFVNDGEKIVRKIFGFQDDNSSTSMAAGMAIGVAALSNAKKIGGATRRGLNTTKALYGKALSNDLGALGKTRLGKGISGVANKFSSFKNNTTSRITNRIKKAGESAKNKVPVIRAASNMAGSAKRTISGAKSKVGTRLSNFRDKHGNLVKVGDFAKKHVWNRMKQKANLSNALGIMAAAMAYSSGTTGALEAIGTGAKVHEGSQEFFESSTDNQANGILEEVEKHTAEDREKLDAITSDKNFERIQDSYSEWVKGAEDADAKRDELKEIEKALEKEKQAASPDTSKIGDLEKRKGDLTKAIEEYDKKGKKIEEEWTSIVVGEDENGEDIHADADWLKYTVSDSGKPRKAKKFKAAVLQMETLKELSFGPQKSDIDKEADEIKKMVLQAQLNATGKTSFNELTLDQQSSVNATSEILMKKISLGVLNNTSLGQEEVRETIVHNLGLDRDGDNRLVRGVADYEKKADSIIDMNGMMSNVDKYQSLMEQQRIAETYREHRGYKGTDESLSKRLASKLT